MKARIAKHDQCDLLPRCDLPEPLIEALEALDLLSVEPNDQIAML